MDFLRLQFENSIEPFVEGDLVNIGRFEYTGADILKLAGDEAYKQAFNDWIWEEWMPARQERKEEILSLKQNSSRYDELKRMLECSRAIPFIGSGMSSSTGMPTWSNFLRETRKKAKGFNASQLERLLSSGRFELAASRIFEGMPERLFNERFEASFSLQKTGAISGPVQFLPMLFDSIGITTNFDNVVETVYGSNGKSFQDILYGTEIGNYRKKVVGGTRCLLKLHGDYAQPASRVLTKCEYDIFYHKKSSGKEELALIFRSGGLVFLGCSLLHDRTMALLKEVADEDKNMPRHYALLKSPKTESECRDREHFLAERNIFPIWYDGDHETDIEAILVGLIADLKRF